MQLENEALHKEIAHMQGLLALAGQSAEPELALAGQGTASRLHDGRY